MDNFGVATHVFSQVDYQVSGRLLCIKKEEHVLHKASLQECGELHTTRPRTGRALNSESSH